MAVHVLRLCKVLSLLPIVILGLNIAIASADGEHDAGAWCDERIRELEIQFNSRLTNEVQSTQVRADESCNHRLAETAAGNSSCQQEAADLQARLAETQALLEEKEQVIQELETTKENGLNACMEQSLAQAAHIQELEAAKENGLDACMNQMQQQLDSVKAEQLKEIDAAVQKARLEMQEEHARKLKMVQDRRDALADENAQMTQSIRQSKSQLQETKDELFKIRQELFQSNEQLRLASRRWYQILLPAPAVEWLEQTIEFLVQQVQDTWKMTMSSPALSQAKARGLSYLEKAGIPAAWDKFLVHARPLAGMAYAVGTTVVHEMLALLQTMRQELPVYWKEFVKIASRYWKEFIKIAGPKMEQAWEATKETSGRVWEQVREASQPLIDKIPWEKLEPHMDSVKSLWNDLMRDTEWIRAEFSVFSAKAMAVMVQVAETMHRWAIEGFHQAVRTLHLLLKMYEAPAHMVDWTENLHTQSETVLWYIEAGLATILAMFMASKVLGVGDGRSGRRVKADPHANGTSSPKKLLRIAKRQTEKTAKKKQVQFSGR